MGAACPFHTCALKSKGVEFCWDCGENATCEKWKAHRDAGKTRDSFKSYQKLEDDIVFIQAEGVDRFIEVQGERRGLLREMLSEFNDGRSKSYYCIAATILEPDELRTALERVKTKSVGLDAKGKAHALHAAIDDIAKGKGYLLKLRH